MKIIITILMMCAVVFSSCSSNRASHSDKKKMKDYNSIQYGKQKKH